MLKIDEAFWGNLILFTLLLGLKFYSDTFITNSVVNENSVIMNRFLGLIGHFTTQIKSVISNKNDRLQPVHCNEV